MHINEIPFRFTGDLAGMTPQEVLDWIKAEQEGTFPDLLIPFYGYEDRSGYDASASILLFNPVEKQFYEIHGSHCSCYGFEGQFEPVVCPLEYIQKGNVWEDAYPLALEVIAFFEQNPYN